MHRQELYTKIEKHLSNFRRRISPAHSHPSIVKRPGDPKINAGYHPLKNGDVRHLFRFPARGSRMRFSGISPFDGGKGFILFSEEYKKSEPFSYRKKFGFCCFGAPPGTRTLGPLIKRNQRATIVNFQNCVNSLFLSFYRKFAFCICCILCTCYSLLHPLSSRSGVQKVCKNVQSQNQPLKTGIEFLCKALKIG